MRIVTWNCAMGLHRKLDPLLSLQPDVAVIQECANPEILWQRLRSVPYTSVAWLGENPNKGLGVFGFNGTKIEPLPGGEPLIKLALPVRVEGNVSFNLLAVWSFNNRGEPGRQKLPNPVTVAAERHQCLFESGRGIVAGDFNNSAIWDSQLKVSNFSAVATHLEQLGLKSAYHYTTGEPFGGESQPSHYWRDRKKDGHRYHIDYVFVPLSWLERGTLRLGSFEEFCSGGISDHVPLIWDVCATSII